MNDIYNWIKVKNKNTEAKVLESKLSKSNFWFYDMYNGRIINRKNSFFSIYAAEYYREDNFQVEQPIIVQNEVGYLGIIFKIVDSIPYFLLQAKIEPGNVNVVQVSPTIQATKSNFTRAHGGKLPEYFDVFEKCSGKDVIYDQIQPEQSTRFYKKFNRNLIIKDCDGKTIVRNDDFRWVSYNELYDLLKIDNVVNMDTRTVISGFPYDLLDNNLINEHWLKSIHSNDINDELNCIFHMIDNRVMFHSDKVILKPLYELRDWKIADEGIYCNKDFNYEVKYFDIFIEGRENQNWMQPLFCSKGEAIFGLIIKMVNGEYKILVSIKKFIGSNSFEIAPTIQKEYIERDEIKDSIEELFFEQLKNKSNIVVDVCLSEEGGRFYHEQNRNIIIKVVDDIELPDGYFFLSLGTLKKLIQMTQLVNIQLRNLISLINVCDKYEN